MGVEVAGVVAPHDASVGPSDAMDPAGAALAAGAAGAAASSDGAGASFAHDGSVSAVGRFAPSPTGRMHLGNILASLLAWLSVRSQGGKLVLRIEDLDDRARSGPWDTLLMDDLRWLGLDWDEGPHYQTDRLDLYAAAVSQLESMGLVYPCFCTRAELHAASAPHASDGTPVYAGTCRGLTEAQVAERAAVRAPALRLRVPAKGDPVGAISFADRTFGPHREMLAAECGDFLVRRSDGVYAYQLAVVVDDAAMGVTEVVRGCDLLGSTARQMYLQDLLGYGHPSYAHVPLLVAPDGRRLSKRDRDCDMAELRARFCAPEALLGKLAYAAGLAPSPEPRSAEQLVDGFSWEVVRMHRGNIVVGQGFFA